MRNKIISIIIAIFVLNIGMCVAQTKVDPAPLGILQNDTNNLVQKNPTHFIKSWNWWQEGRSFDEALGMNTGHDYNVELFIS